MAGGDSGDDANGDGEDCGVCAGCKTNKGMMKREMERERERKIGGDESENIGAMSRDQRLIEPA